MTQTVRFVRVKSKMTSANFNVSTNKYCRLSLEYYKSNYGLNTNRYYSINVPGLLPAFHYSPDYQNNGMSRSVLHLIKPKRTKACRLVSQSEVKNELRSCSDKDAKDGDPVTLEI